MPLVKVSIGPLVASVVNSLPKRSDKAVVVRQLGAAAMQYWKRLAQDQLRSTSRDYVAGLQHEQAGEGVRITLRGMMPNMVENGWPGGDLRDWLLKGPNAKLGRDGMYNTVPFRHGTPGSSGRNVGRPMPQELHSPAKRLAPTLTRPDGGTRWGERLHPDVFRMSRQAKDRLNELHRPWHSTSIYMGMVRQEKTYRAATQSQYTTFRRISRHSNDPRSWYHPGIRPRHFARQTAAHLETIVLDIVRGAVGT